MTSGSNDRSGSISPRSIINEIIRTMRESAIDLYSYRLVPTVFHVLLRRDDADRLGPIRQNIVAETKKALDDELVRLNAAGLVQKLFQRNIRHERSTSVWTVDLSADPDERIPPGSCTVRCEFGGAAQAQILAGEPTRFEAFGIPEDGTPGSLHDCPTPEPQAMTPASSDSGRSKHSLATICYYMGDGCREFAMNFPEVRIQSGRVSGLADLGLPAEIYARVSLVIRMDSRTGNFCIRNLSSDSVTVAGRKISCAVEVLLDRESVIDCQGGGKLEFRALGTS